MSTTVKVTLKEKTLMKSLGLGQSKKGQKYLAGRVKARCGKYVPRDTGLLINSAVVSGTGDSITYVQPYAKVQFYENYHHQDPRRGPKWHRRMLTKEKTALLGEVKRYVEGRPG